eukprot:scaffold174270_cov53-Attheya_sp.AAC.2
MGGRAKQAAALLTQMGYNDVVALEETFDQLAAAEIFRGRKEGTKEEHKMYNATQENNGRIENQFALCALRCSHISH